jgi:cytochrome c peroxidase
VIILLSSRFLLLYTMASAARSASRAFLRSTPATSSFRPAARSTRFALPSQGFRAASRRGYASEASSGKSSNTFLWAGIAIAGGAGAYFYLQGGDAAVSSKTFVPTKEDYQKVYDAIADRLANETDYDDGSYGPVSLRCHSLPCFPPEPMFLDSDLSPLFH